MHKVVTVRLPESQVKELESLATFDGVAIAEEIREAISLLLKTRSEDPAFVQRVRTAYEHARKVLNRLEGGNDIVDALGDPLAAVESPNAPERVAETIAAAYSGASWESTSSAARIVGERLPLDRDH